MSDVAQLMKQSTNLGKLADKYGNFMVPTAHIIINGERPEKHAIVAESVRISLSLESTSANFTLKNVYDPVSRKFRSDARNLSKLGSVVSIEIGYGSELSEVFCGYIHEANFTISGDSSIEITAMDVHVLMQNNNSFLKKFEDQTYDKVLKKVLEGYKPLVKKITIDGKMAEGEPPLQTGTDLEYIRRLCDDSNMEFFILGSECFIRPKEQKKSVIMKLEGNRGLISFSKRMVYKDLVLKTRIIDEAAAAEGKKQPDPITAPVKTDEKYTHDLNIKQEKFTVSNRDDDANSAKEKLENMKQEILKDTQGGNGEIIGLPDLIPGRHIEITKMDDIMNGIYYLKSVTHSINSGGFTTSFEVGGYGE